jgi:hypothetical protein
MDHQWFVHHQVTETYLMRMRVGDTSIISSSPIYVTTSSSDMVRIGDRRMFSS